MSTSASRTDEPLICGIDVGSTNVKVILVNEHAHTVWTKSIPVPRVLQGGRPATDAMTLVATLEEMIIEGWNAVGATLPLGAIAITGVGEDGVPVSAGLQPLDHAIPWFDRRAEREAEALRTELGDAVNAGITIDFSRTAAKWAWLRKHRPQAMQDASLWIALTDYPAAWWSQKPFMSETLAARTACYDVFAREWIPVRLDTCGAPPLPDVVKAGTAVGCVQRGSLLVAGAATSQTLIVAGGHDHPIAASAVRRLSAHALVDSLGTANLMYDEVRGISPRVDPYLAFSVPALGGAGVACLGVFEFSATLAPYRDVASGDALQGFLTNARAPGAPAPLPDVFEALERSLRPGRVMQAVDPLKLRASLEAACLYARCVREAIGAAGSAASPIYAVGGWARSDALLELRASVFGEPVTTIEEDELTALGVALVALDAVRPSSERAAFHRRARVVEPNPQWVGAYERIFAGFHSFANEIRKCELGTDSSGRSGASWSLLSGDNRGCRGIT